MSDEDKRLEQLLDLLVYAPLGLALEYRDLLPKLAERGRGQVALMRLAQKVASDSSGRADTSEQIRSTLLDTLDTLAAWFGADACGADRPSAEDSTQPTRAAADESAQPARTGTAATAEAAGDGLAQTDRAAAPTSPGQEEGAECSTGSGEPFPGYDQMTAREIIDALAGMSEPDLRAVASHEQRNRARSTVLNRVSRLLG